MGKGIAWLQEFDRATRALPTEETVSDATLEARVRSTLERYVSHPNAIQVAARHGWVILSGPVLTSEASDLLISVCSLRGVSHIINRLEIHAQANQVPPCRAAGKEPAWQHLPAD